LSDGFIADIPVCVRVPAIDWKKTLASLKVDSSIGEIDWLKPGEKSARAHLKKFIKEKLARYPEDRNDPNLDGQSNLSPYLHFGQLSPLRAALEVKNSSAPKEAKEAFLEELIVRRELSDNFCFHQPKYDKVDGFPEWAQKNAAEHRDDRREYLYTPKQLEAAETHDDLWNAAQTELVKRGTIPGYLRMYWGKKILEWTETPEEAMAAAIDLNDRYQLDGRDPNGYAGVAWSIGGVHDRPWPSRKVFGKVRYMNYNGCRRKFNVKAYIARVAALKPPAAAPRP
jgi:deoxyribodipyrimidine photo-lyase